MIVAMTGVRVMTMTFDHVVDVVAVLHGLVAAGRAVDVLRIMTFANMGNAGFRAHALSYEPA